MFMTHQTLSVVELGPLILGRPRGNPRHLLPESRVGCTAQHSSASRGKVDRDPHVVIVSLRVNIYSEPEYTPVCVHENVQVFSLHASSVCHATTTATTRLIRQLVNAVFILNP